MADPLDYNLRGILGLSSSFNQLFPESGYEAQNVPSLNGQRPHKSAKIKADASSYGANPKGIHANADGHTDYTNALESERYIMRAKKEETKGELDAEIMKAVQSRREELVKAFKVLHPELSSHAAGTGSDANSQFNQRPTTVDGQTRPGNLGVGHREPMNLNETISALYFKAIHRYLLNRRLPLAGVIATDFQNARRSYLEDEVEVDVDQTQCPIEEIIIYTWEMFHHTFENEFSMEGNDGPYRKASSGVMSFLEKLQRDHIKRVTVEGDPTSKLDFERSSIRSYYSYVSSRIRVPQDSTDAEEYILWAVLFYAFRTGDENVAIEASVKLLPQSFEFHEIIRSYFRNIRTTGLRGINFNQIPPDRIEYYSRNSRNNPYHKLCIGILARKIDTTDNVLLHIEDSIWYYLVMSQDNPEELRKLQELVSTHITKEQGSHHPPLLQAFFNFLCLNYEKGIEVLSSSHQYYQNCNHFVIYLLHYNAFSLRGGSVPRVYLDNRGIYITQLIKKNMLYGIEYSFLLGKDESIAFIRDLALDKQSLNQVLQLLEDRQYMSLMFPGIGYTDTYFFELLEHILRGLGLRKMYDSVEYLCIQLYQMEIVPLQLRTHIVKSYYGCLVPQMNEYNRLKVDERAAVRSKIEMCVSLLQGTDVSVESEVFDSLYSVVLFYYIIDIYHQCEKSNDRRGQLNSAIKARSILLERIYSQVAPTRAGNHNQFDFGASFDRHFQNYPEGKSHLSYISLYYSEILKYLASNAQELSDNRQQLIMEEAALSKLITNPRYESRIFPQHRAQIVQNLQNAEANFTR